MKVRQMFVSNSSSSSYIIAYKTGDRCEHCGRSDVDLAKMFKGNINAYCDDTKLIAKGLQEITDRLEDSYYDEVEWCNEEEPNDVKYKEELFKDLMSTVSKVTKCSDSGYNIVWLRISYADDKIFTSMLEQVDHKIIRG